MNKLITIEYIWVGGCDPDYTLSPRLRYRKPYTIRSKTRVIYTNNQDITLDNIPIWNYDGSSTGQAETKKSEIFLCPRALFNDPFKDGIMVLCDTYIDCDCTIPHKTNTRYTANDIFNKKLDEEPWFGIEQEFFLMCSEDNLPIGFNPLVPQGQYYCSVGSRNTFGRELVEKIAMYALASGIKLSGWNAEVAPGQWEFQVGPLIGINSGDHLWMLRYIMERVTEGTSLYIELHPKPIIYDTSNLKKPTDWDTPTEWNGSGAHTNYSTKAMREEGGMKVINDAIEKLATNHKEHVEHYGEFNDLRLSSRCETSSFEKFTYGIADRTASMRIPTETVKNGYGYIEDRRPSSIMDPYKVTALIFKTTCLI
jgi:glutamine synthetase